MFWTEKRVAQLTKMTREGKVFREIAEILGCTRNAVIGKVHRMGLNDKVPLNKKKKKTVRRVAAKAKSPKPSSYKYKPIDSAIDVQMPTPSNHKGLHLLDLEPHHCRFPIGQGADITFCGQQIVHGYSFCASCKDVVFRDG